ncbi:MAG: hypothetical protein WB780_23145 [Candidatus Acidiferrales bacterium]
MKTTSRWYAFVFVVMGLLMAVSVSSAQDKPQAKLSASAIQIVPVHSDEVKIPAEFQMALYEHAIEEIQKTGKFQHVYRDGDKAAADTPDLLILRGDVTGFKPGSERKRQVTTVAGTTSVTIHCQFVDKTGKVVLERDITGKVRFLGGNLRATYDFAKKGAKMVQENFQ